MRFRPYISYTPFIPNPFIAYEITGTDERTLRKLFTLFNLASLKTSDLQLKNASITRSKADRAAKQLINKGTLEVRGLSDTMIVHNLQNINKFWAACEGTYTSNEQKTTQVADAKFRNLSERDLSDFVVFYPHIPATMVKLLKGIEPSVYNSARLISSVNEGDWVKEGQVIAKYGKVEINATHDGRIELLGNSEAGIYEWPNEKNVQPHGDYEEGDPLHLSPNFNIGQVIFDKNLEERDCYSFALRPVHDPKMLGSIRAGAITFFTIGKSFDHGVIAERSKGLGRFIGLTVQDKFCGLPDHFGAAVVHPSAHGSNLNKLPDHLRQDQQFLKQMVRYRGLTQQGAARVVAIVDGNLFPEV